MGYGWTWDQPEDGSSELGLPWSGAYSYHCYAAPFQELQSMADLRKHLHREISAKIKSLHSQNILWTCEVIMFSCQIMGDCWIKSIEKTHRLLVALLQTSYYTCSLWKRQQREILSLSDGKQSLIDHVFVNDIFNTSHSIEQVGGHIEKPSLHDKRE